MDQGAEEVLGGATARSDYCEFCLGGAMLKVGPLPP
jgi:hypothetical protein